MGETRNQGGGGGYWAAHLPPHCSPPPQRRHRARSLPVPRGRTATGGRRGRLALSAGRSAVRGGGGGFGHQILGCGGTGGCRPTNGIQDPSHGAVTAANQDAEIWHVPKEIEPGGEGKGRKEGREGGQGWLPPSQHLHTPCPIPSLPWVGSSLLQVVDLPGVQQVLELPEHSAGDGKVGWGGPTPTSP